MTIHRGDCRQLMPALGPFDMILADPPYGETSLSWDHRVDGWLDLARAALKPTGSMWVFGSMRFFMATAAEFAAAGLRVVQDIVWEKHNGSNSLADRFRRVHENAVQFVHADAEWRLVFNDPQVTHDARQRIIKRRKQRAPHFGKYNDKRYESEDGGPKLMRSVLKIRSCHGVAIHPTEKPVELLSILIRTSCPRGGVVGDWFAGSGAGGEACLLSDRRYVGCEIDPGMAAKANRRLSEMLPFAG